MSEITVTVDPENTAIVQITVDENSAQAAVDAAAASQLALDKLLATSIGVAVPADVPAGTGFGYWLSVTPGPYPNHGGVVVNSGSLALILRSDAGAFSVSQSALTIPVPENKMNFWAAEAYPIGTQRNHLGKDWYLPTSAALSTDVPGTSVKWVERLTAYAKQSNLEIIENKTSEILETSEDFKFSYAIADELGNVAFGIDYQGQIYFNEVLSSFISKLSNSGFLHELESGVYKISKLKTTGDGGEIYLLDELNNIALFCSEKGIFKLKIDPTYFLINARSAGLFKSNYDQKNLLAIGDSLTAILIWQIKCAELLGATSTTHALGGIDFIGMVDGYGALPALSVADVTGKDIIVLFGGYNERTQPLGVVGDVYPTQNTVAGRLQYAINKIYGLLTAANNLTCRVVIATPHCTGANGYIYVDGYTKWNGSSLKEIAEIMVSVSNQNNIPCYNSWEKSGIGKFNWNVFQSSATPNNSTYTYKGDFASIGAVNFTPVTNDVVTVNLYTGYLFTGGTWVMQTTPKFPWKNDQLHLNTLGYEYLGKKFAQFINTI